MDNTRQTTLIDPHSPIDRRSMIMGMGLTAMGAGAYLATPESLSAPIRQTDFEKLIPKSVGNWNSKSTSQLVLPAKDDLEKKLYENLETRIFEGPNLPSIMFLLAYSSKQKGDIQVHRPEVCYPVAGFPIKETRFTKVEFGPATLNAVELIADRQGMNEHILYWVRVGNDYPTGFWTQRISMAKASLFHGIPDGLLLRISVLENDKNFNRDSLKNFLKHFEKSSSDIFKLQILLGAAIRD